MFQVHPEMSRICLYHLHMQTRNGITLRRSTQRACAVGTRISPSPPAPISSALLLRLAQSINLFVTLKISRLHSNPISLLVIRLRKISLEINMLAHPSAKENGSSTNTYRSCTYQIKDNPDHQTATWTHADILSVAQIVDGDLEAVAAWTGEMVDLHRRIEGHVFDFDLIVNGE